MSAVAKTLGVSRSNLHARLTGETKTRGHTEGEMKRHAAQNEGGWVLPPPISRHEAEQVFGAAIPTEAWKKITCAFSRHSQNLDALDTSTSNKNKNDPNSWTTQKLDAEKTGPCN
jgi:hypothetical protein